MDEARFRTGAIGAPGTLPFSGVSTFQAPPSAPEARDVEEKEVISTSGPTGNESKPAKSESPAPYPWILNPTIDILFSCGGAFWIIYLGLSLTGMQANFTSTPAAGWFFFVSIVGLHLFGDSHQPATLMRVYGSKITRDALGVPVAIVGVISLFAGLSTLLIPATTVFFIKLILAWGFQHQLAQSYGIALVYCYKRKFYLSKVEKNIMFAMVQATIVFLCVRMLSIKDFGMLTINLYDVPFWAILPEWTFTVSLIALQLSVLAFAGMVINKYVREKKLFPLPAMATILTLTLMPLIAGDKFSIIWYLFSQWFFHSSQYLVITSAFYFKEKGLPENVPLNEIGRMLWTRESAKYFGLIFGVGFCTAYLLPNFMFDQGVATKGVCFASIWVLINFQHFITDAFIWKLRDPQIQKLLVS